MAELRKSRRQMGAFIPKTRSYESSRQEGDMR